MDTCDRGPRREPRDFLRDSIASECGSGRGRRHEGSVNSERSVVRPVADAPSQEIALPGNTEAFIDAPIYARTNGYLKRWYVDIGTRVKAGQLLAEIETPEVDEQLQQARANLETAQANYNIAKITASRWEFLVSTGSVSQQETDQAKSALVAQKAAADASQSNVRRLEELQSFEKIYAPFDGVITARNTDIGALIDAGASAPKELFHLAAINIGVPSDRSSSMGWDFSRAVNAIE